MGIRVDPDPPVGDLKAVIAKTVEAIYHLVWGNKPSSVKKAYEAFQEYRHGDETPEQLAWSLWRESLAGALADFFDWLKEIEGIEGIESKDRVEQILCQTLESSAELATGSSEVRLEAHHVTRPVDFPLYKTFRENLPDLVASIAVGQAPSSQRLRVRMNQCFTENFERVWNAGTSNYRALEERLFSKSGQAARRAGEWRRYFEWLHEYVKQRLQPDPGRGDSALADTFLPLRAYWHQQSEGEVVTHVGWFNTETTAWLYQDEPGVCAPGMAHWRASASHRAVVARWRLGGAGS